jgi:D-sedoheptulose 7-phosphate isomerase
VIEYLNRLHDALVSTQTSTADGSRLALDEAANRAVDYLRQTHDSEGKIMLVGNGGSAAIASHMQNDLAKAGGLRALVFTEQPLLTAYSNDDGYESAYESSAKLWAEKSDVLIAISSSGSSKNILRTCEVIRSAGGRIITFSGFSQNNPLRSTGDVNFYVDSDSFGTVETAHAALGHFVTDSVAGLID